MLLYMIFLFYSKLSWAQSDCIGVVPAGTFDFWSEVSLGAKKAGEELGLKVVIRGPSKELESQDAQAKIVRWMKCKGYVVAPINQQTMIPLISRPVVFIDRKIKNDRDDITLVATNNYKVGIKIGELVVKKIDASAKIGMFRLSPEITSTTDRENGFSEAIRNAKRKIFFEQATGSSSVEVIRQKLQFYRKDLEKLDALFVPNESSIHALLLEAKYLKLKKSILIVTVDNPDFVQKAIDSGIVYATAVQSPQKMGYLGVKILKEQLEGKSHGEYIEVPFEILTRKSH